MNTYHIIGIVGFDLLKRNMAIIQQQHNSSVNVTVNVVLNSLPVYVNYNEHGVIGVSCVYLFWNYDTYLLFLSNSPKK